MYLLRYMYVLEFVCIYLLVCTLILKCMRKCSLIGIMYECTFLCITMSTYVDLHTYIYYNANK